MLAQLSCLGAPLDPTCQLQCHCTGSLPGSHPRGQRAYREVHPSTPVRGVREGGKGKAGFSQTLQAPWLVSAASRAYADCAASGQTAGLPGPVFMSYSCCTAQNSTRLFLHSSGGQNSSMG